MFSVPTSWLISFSNNLIIFFFQLCILIYKIDYLLRFILQLLNRFFNSSLILHLLHMLILTIYLLSVQMIHLFYISNVVSLNFHFYYYYIYFILNNPIHIIIFFHLFLFFIYNYYYLIFFPLLLNFFNFYY